MSAPGEDDAMFEKKQKIQKLIALAEESKTLPLSTLATELSVNGENLEEFLINAIHTGAISVSGERQPRAWRMCTLARCRQNQRADQGVHRQQL